MQRHSVFFFCAKNSQAVLRQRYRRCMSSRLILTKKKFEKEKERENKAKKNQERKGEKERARSKINLHLNIYFKTNK